MPRLILSLMIAILFSVPVIAQVDTLRLIQISSISIPGNPHGYITADLQNNGTVYLIAYNTSQIYIYNGSTSELIWTSPLLNAMLTPNWQIELCDMNGDGDLDLATEDTVSVKIFDVIHNQVLWTSPAISPSSTSFGLGDRNSDGYPDVIMAHRGPTDLDNNPDSAWIETYDGPDYHFALRTPFLIGAYNHGYPDYLHMTEEPGRIIVADLSGNQSLQRKIIMFDPISEWALYWDGVYIHNININRGETRIFDPTSLVNSADLNTYKMASYMIKQYDGQHTYLYGNSRYYSVYSNDQGDHSNQTYDFINCISANQIVSSREVGWYNTNVPDTRYSGPVIGEIMPSQLGDELCLGLWDSLRLVSYPDYARIWVNHVDSIAMRSLYLFQSSLLFDAPQILAGSGYPNYNMSTYSGSNGNLTSVFEDDSVPPGLYVNTIKVVDINGDGDDEIVRSYLNNAAISIYKAIDIHTAVDDNGSLPSSFSLHPAYPNPFNATTTISYDLPKEADVSLEIYDILGRKIATLVDGHQEVGTHHAVWDASGVSSGLYFYRLKTGDYSDIRKMTLLK